MIDPREHKYEELKQMMDVALKVNLEIRLFRETFYLIERAVLHRKLQKIIKFGELIKINCCECGNQHATKFCPQCSDHYCQDCATSVHKMMPIFSSHELAPININPTSIII